MPELPEVETVVRGLRPDVEGRTFTRFTSYWSPQLNDIPPETVHARLKGQKISRLWRRAKYIVFECTHDFLLIHLKMTGRLFVTNTPPEDRWIRAEFGLDDGNTLYFSDLRKFGKIILTASLEEITHKIGPEPLEETFTPEQFLLQFQNRSKMIKPLLLDQGFIAGVGNIYADEALWEARIDPRRNSNTLNSDEKLRLYHAIRLVLQKGIEKEGASINWYRKPDGTTGEQQNHFKAYGQEGEPCQRCGTEIQKIKLVQRGTHFCANCQN